MIAPTPPWANLDSQLMRVWVSEPSSLSKRPEMFERKTRFLTVRLRKVSGWKISSNAIGPLLCGAPDGGEQRRHPGVRRAAAPALRHEGHLGVRVGRMRRLQLQQDERGRLEIP